MLTFKKENYFKDGIGVDIHLPKKTDANQPPHLHEFVELVYIVQGRGVHGIDGVEYTVSRGCLLFINYRQVHYFRSEKDMIIQNILLDPKWISEKLINSENAFEIFTLSAFSQFQKEIDEKTALVRFEGESRRRIEQLIEQMLREKQKAQAGYATVLKAQVDILLTMILREMSGVQNRTGLSLDSAFLEYIKANCDKKLSLEKLARDCFYNPSYFSRMFREHYGMTLTDFINSSRLENAKSLLQTSNLSIQEISDECGFCSKSAFYRQFVKSTGKTPGAYRQLEAAPNPSY